MNINKNLNYKLIALILLGFVIYACNETCDSLLDENRKIKIAFKKISKKTLIDTTIANISVTNLPDTFFYNGVQTSSLILPLAQNTDSSTFILTVDSLKSKSRVNDTLTFFYNKKLVTVSSACGFNTTFTLTKAKVTHYKIDSIMQVQTAVNSDVTNNYNLVFK